MVDDKYWCGVADAAFAAPIAAEPIALTIAIECCGECWWWAACVDADVVDDVTTADAFVKLEFDDGEFSPDVDGIDDGS